MPTRRPQRTVGEQQIQQRNCLWACASLLLLDAENDLDQCTALFVIQLGIDATRSQRYGPRGPYNAVQSDDFFTILLRHFSDRKFKSWLRMSKDAFWHLYELIEKDPVFHVPGKRPQRPVEYQLVAFLCRFGNTTALKTATITTVSEGSIYNYCNRVRHAFRNLRDKYLCWPDAARRKEISRVFAEFGFPGCIGIVDGSLIPLRDKPLVDGAFYFTRKHFYGLNMQAICNHEGRFIDYDLGWPGSVHDARVFTNSRFWRMREEYLENDEFILADKGYPLTPFTIRPFDEGELKARPEKLAVRRKWNKALSHVRIGVEHTFGRLKGRFRALQGMPGRDLQEMMRCIEALLIIQNILLDFGERGDDMEDLDESDDEQEDGETVAQRMEHRADRKKAHQAGIYRRKQLIQYAIDTSII